MARPILDEKLWVAIKPLLPEPRTRRARYPGRKPLSQRQALTGILFVLKTGIPWQDLPVEMGCGSGMTCWRRLQEWQQAGVWQQVQTVVKKRWRDADRIDWSRASGSASS